MSKIGIFILFLIVCSCSKPNDEIVLLPDKGIVIGKDTVFLETTYPKSLTERFNIRDTADNEGVHWDGYDADGNEAHGYYEIERIHFKGMKFEFTGPTVDSLLLDNIYINIAASPYKITIDSIDIRQSYSAISKKFPNSMRTGILHGNASDHGILFQTDTVDRTPRIIGVSIHTKL